jgi:hypothetical protein
MWCISWTDRPLGTLLSAGHKVGLESGLGVLIAGLGIPFIGFAIGGAALGLALREGGIIRLVWFSIIAFLPGFLVLVIPLAIPWLFMDSNSEIYVINYDDSWREKTCRRLLYFYNTTIVLFSNWFVL